MDNFTARTTYGLSGANQSQSQIALPVNYIYISHLDLAEEEKYFILPSYPDQLADNMQSNFNQTNALGRSAPIFTYSNSGPRSVQFHIVLHRDLMDDVNSTNLSITPEPGADYVDTLIRALQSIAVPKYNITGKLVEPPWVALRLSNEVFIRGVVSGSVSVEYQKPVLENGKYAVVNVTFTIYEIDPYDASSVFTNGSFRGMTKSLILEKMGFDPQKQ